MGDVKVVDGVEKSSIHQNKKLKNRSIEGIVVDT